MQVLEIQGIQMRADLWNSVCLMFQELLVIYSASISLFHGIHSTFFNPRVCSFLLSQKRSTEPQNCTLNFPFDASECWT